MYPTQKTCQECDKPVDLRSHQYVSDSDIFTHSSKAWHFACMPLDRVASGEQPIRTEYAMSYYAWHVQQLLHENRVLRQRTGALLRALKQQMTANGATGEDLADLQEDYSLQDTE